MQHRNGKRGMVCVVEGLDYSGKTTLAEALVVSLQAEGYRAVYLREPGGTPMGEVIRGAVKDAGLPRSPLCALLLFLAARADLVERRVKYHLAAGDIVVLDRFTPSTIAYQGYMGETLGWEVFTTLLSIAEADLQVDLVLWLDVPVQVAMERRASTPRGGVAQADTWDSASEEVFEKYRASYQQQFLTSTPGSWLHISATKSLEAILYTALSLILGRYEALQEEVQGD